MEKSKQRIGFIDEVRGFAILCMVVYHLVYDLLTIYPWDFPFFFSTPMNTIRDIFAGAFIFISGSACRLSHNNGKRGALCLACGLICTAVTCIVVPSEAIWFGILHCLGVCMLLFWILRPLLDKIPKWAGILLCVFLFFCTAWLKNGFFGIPPLAIALPEPQNNLLAPLGWINSSFYSSDYFPLLPWMFVFLAGSYFGVYLVEKKLPGFFYRTHIPWLAAVGRHTLWIYLLHQPVISAVLWLIQ